MLGTRERRTYFAPLDTRTQTLKSEFNVRWGAPPSEAFCMRPLRVHQGVYRYHIELAKQNTLAPQVEEQPHASTLQPARLVHRLRGRPGLPLHQLAYGDAAQRITRREIKGLPNCGLDQVTALTSSALVVQ
jgi:hypothetical protein